MLCIELLFVTLKIDVIPVHTFVDFFFIFPKEWFTVFLFTFSNSDGCETSIVLEALMKFLFLIWVIYFIELFVDSATNFNRFWKTWCYSWFRFFFLFFVLGMAFLRKCLLMNLLTVARKDLNDKFGFSLDSVRTSFHLTLWRSLSKAEQSFCTFVKDLVIWE